MLIYKSILPTNTLIAFWKMEETEEQLRAICTLTDEDNHIIERCSAQKRRIELLSVRALLKTIGLDQTIHYNDRRPYLDKGYISISHSSNIAAIIFNPDFPVGIDVEAISPRIQRIANRAFSDKEIVAAANNLEKLTVLWNCKECVFKLANDEGIDFRKMIEVALPSTFLFPEIQATQTSLLAGTTVKHSQANEHLSIPIECKLTKSGQSSHFSLHAIKIEGNTAVWGNFVRM